MNRMARLHGFLGFFIFICMLSVHPPDSNAQKARSSRDPIVIQVINLDYADGEYLASVLAPLLSTEGQVVAYKPTNSIIIKDRASLVKRLVEIIKGRPEPK